MKRDNLLFAILALLLLLVLLVVIASFVPKFQEVNFSPSERLSPLDVRATITGNNAPAITDYYPINLEFSASDTTDLYFNASFQDPDGDLLNVIWYVDGEIAREVIDAGNFDEFIFNFGCDISGGRKIKVEVSDGQDFDSIEWAIDLSLVACNSGGGDGGGNGGNDEIYNFSLSRDLISINLKQGEDKVESFIVENVGDLALNIVSSVVGSNLVSLNPKSFDLSPSQTRIVDVIFETSISETIGINTATINLKHGSISRNINVILNVLDFGLLFDLDSKLESSVLLRNGKLFANINMTAISNQGLVSVDVKYFVKDFENNLISLGEESLNVDGFLSIDREFVVPKEVTYGRHLFYVELDYADKTASTSNTFRISPASLWYRILLISISIILLIIAGLLAYYLYKKNKEREKLMGPD